MGNEEKNFKSGVIGWFEAIRITLIVALIASAAFAPFCFLKSRFYGYALLSSCFLEFLITLSLSFVCEALSIREILGEQIKSLGNTILDIQKKLDKMR